MGEQVINTLVFQMDGGKSSSSFLFMLVCARVRAWKLSVSSNDTVVAQWLWSSVSCSSPPIHLLISFTQYFRVNNLEVLFYAIKTTCKQKLLQRKFFCIVCTSASEASGGKNTVYTQKNTNVCEIRQPPQKLLLNEMECGWKGQSGS